MILFAQFDLSSTLWISAGVFAGTFVASIVMVTVLLVYMPADYFQPDRKQGRDDRPVLRWVVPILKNLVGVVLIVMGVLMLVLPGQGVLTILIGVMLVDFPGKHKLQRKLMSRPGVLKTV